MKKEKKQLRYPGLKAGSIYGTVIFFIIPLIDTLTSENPNFINLLTANLTYEYGYHSASSLVVCLSTGCRFNHLLY